MKTFVVSVGIILLAGSAQLVPAHSLNETSAHVAYARNVPSRLTPFISTFYCTVTVDGIVVMEGIAEGTSAEELEEKLERQYALIFCDEQNPPVVKAKCIPVEKKR